MTSTLNRPDRPVTTLTIGDAISRLMPAGVPFRFTAYDGSTAGPQDSPFHVHLENERGLSYLLTAPGDLGVVRAYVSGDLTVDGVHPGDPYELMLRLQAEVGMSIPSAAEAFQIVRGLGWSHLKPPPPPPQEALPRWRRLLEGLRHSKGRDADAIRHHYDVSNRFYELLLGPSMVYSCAYFEDPSDPLEVAQERKLELICRKLRLQPGERLLDIGCGWGSLLLHAAEHHGVRGVGVTLSGAQAELARERIRAAGLADRLEVRVLDYRELDDGPFDKIASVGMYEHVGRSELDRYVEHVHTLLRPGGLFLNHGIARLRSAPPDGDTFISRYVFPDGELHPVTDVIGALEAAGLEVRDVESLREHYPLTLRRWGDNLARNRAAAIAEAGTERERVWRLYILGSALSFEAGEITVYQVLSARDGAPHGLPLARAAL